MNAIGTMKTLFTSKFGLGHSLTSKGFSAAARPGSGDRCFNENLKMWACMVNEANDNVPAVVKVARNNDPCPLLGLVRH